MGTELNVLVFPMVLRIRIADYEERSWRGDMSLGTRLDKLHGTKKKLAKMNSVKVNVMLK